ncbi:putative membrane protein DUF2339 [Paenibacillus cellulosilyticus]|uniref:Putative membrane protein DUF2339 n=1 Tax=Paenibacillus cellulosilyticus TaxID=375489 RepID=A0A2V2Z2Z5_9BACL|nr:DUF2339 domain-containing protein [Paenibacillus cellulosilyticus]PWW07465.1 putative membrane protein DUF2339 [Paenibacillus cellulosilyticus]QKS44379.1 DUF2339 domain-containing protein [Paenibacillus cellulosilyticus]
MEAWKKHWTTVLGAVFVLVSFITLLKYGSDQGWITDPIKIGAGLLVGAAAGGVGLALHRRGGSIALAGEIGAGLGAAVWYSTSAYAGIYTGLWEPMLVLIVMSIITVAIASYAYVRNSRMLMIVSLAGAMMAPLVMRPESDQVLQLFLYLLVINAVMFAVSIAKSWVELRWTSFGFTWLLYAVYYVHFDPISDGWWSMPMRYLIAAFVFYLIAFYAAAWRTHNSFLCTDIYISFANTVLFGAWAAGLLQSHASMTTLMLVIGVAYGSLALLLYRIKGTAAKPAAAGYIHGALGAIALLIGASGLGTGSLYRPLVAVFIWVAIAAVVVWLGRRLRNDWLLASGTFIWLVTGLYWFSTAWDVPRLNWFGDMYVPFLNGGALAWIALAALGFYMSRKVTYAAVAPTPEFQSFISVVYAIAGHLIVGGLLTIQVMDWFDEYHWSGHVDLFLSVVWAIHALLLFVWGAYSSQRIFRWFGSAVLVIVALKAILLDLSGEDSIYKIIVFLALGIISMSISWINAKWKAKLKA